MLLHYLKIAWRNILRNKFRYLFTAVSLAVGIVVVTFTLYTIFQERKAYTQFENHERIAELFVMESSGSSRIYHHPFTSDMVEEFVRSGAIPGVRKIGIFKKSDGAVSFEKDKGILFPYSSVIGYVNKDFFDVFSSTFISGNSTIWNESDAVITRRYAEKIYGEEEAVGKRVRYEDKYYTIAGVIKEYSSPGIVSADVYIPIHGFNSGTPYVLLDEGADIGFINDYLSDKELLPGQVTRGGEFMLRVISDREFDGFQKFLHSLIIITCSLVLLTAFINSLNLSVSFLLGRSREVVLRKTMGASFQSIWATAILTDLFVFVFALLIAASFSELLVGAVNTGMLSSLVKGVWIESSIVFRLLASVFAGLLVAAIVFISMAIYRVAKPISVQGFRGVLNKGSRRGTRNALLIAQLSICFLFVGITWGLHLQYKEFFHEYGQLMNIGSKESDQVLKLNLTASGIELWNNAEAIMTEIEQVKGIGNILQVGGFSIVPTEIEIKLNKDDELTLPVLNARADENYFSFFNLTESENAGGGLAHGMVIINEAFARKLYEKSSQNSFYIGDRLVNVTQVKSDMPFVPNNQPGFLEILNIDPMKTFSTIYIRCSPGKAASVQRDIIAIVHEYIPEYPLQIQPLREEINSRTNHVNQVRDLFLLLGVLSLIISMFGVYVAIVTDTKHRQKEVAIRKVNGAGVKNILQLFGRMYIKMLLISLVISFPLFLLALNLIGLLHIQNVSVWNLPFWSGLIIIVAGFVFITVFWRMWRTAGVTPATILKKE